VAKRKAIKVTDKMISNGVRALRRHVGDAWFVLTDEEIVEVIFRAMLDCEPDTSGRRMRHVQRPTR
jgi:hypothetical protein